MNICETSIRPAASQEASSGCCQPANPQASAWLKKVDLICRIALGVFAAVIAPAPFACSIGIGFIGGMAYAITRLCQHKPLFAAGESKPVCAQGYMDYLSGMRFPPVVGSLATASFIGAHMRHDPQFYVPFCGLFIGLWLGRQSAGIANDLAGRAFTYPTQCQQGCIVT